MKKNLFGKHLAILLGTLAFVVVFGGYYFFVFIPNNQTDVEEKRFRGLQKLEVNVYEKIGNSVALLSDLLQTYKDNKSEYPDSRVQDYIKNYSNGNFKLQQIEDISAKDKNTLATLGKDSLCTYEFTGHELSIQLIKAGKKITLNYNIKQFIDSLLPQDLFDQFILFKESKIVYQTFPSGITEISKDSLQTNKSAFSKNNIRMVHLGGTDYKLFLHQLKLGEGSDFTVAGLLENSEYRSELTKLPENQSLLLVILVVVTLFSLPWIKLYQMGSQDRLSVADGAFSFAVAMLLISLLFLAFLKYNELLRPDTNNSNSTKVNLANDIEKAFASEVDLFYNKLVSFDSLRASTVQLRGNLRNLGSNDLSYGKNSSGGGNKVPGILRSKIDSIYGRPAINQVFWLDSHGTEISNWSKSADNAPHGNFSNRDYSRMLREGKPFFLPGHGVSDSGGRAILPPGNQKIRAQPFYLDQVLSRASGSFTTILSKMSADERSIAAVSFDLKSLSKAIFPKGFSYVIVNKQGKVLYHSDTKRNLNENLLQEFSESTQLQGALVGGNSAFFKTKYLGADNSVFIRPFLNLPYSIVIMEDSRIKNITDVKVFSFVMCMLICLNIFMIAEMLIFFFVSSKNSFFKKKYLDISWLGPHKSFHDQYLFSIVWNSTLLLILLLFYFNSTFFEFLSMLLLSATAVTLLPNLYLLYHGARSEPGKRKLKKNAGIALVAILVVINIGALFVLTSWWIFLLFEVIVLITAIVYLKIAGRITSGFKRIMGRLKAWDYTWAFSAMVFSRLIITSGLPVALFYISAVNYETKLTTRYKHDQLINEIISRNPCPSAKSLAAMNIYKDGAWINSVAIVKRAVAEKDHHAAGNNEQDLAAIFNFATSFKNSIIVGLDAFQHDPANGQMTFSPLFEKGAAITCYQLPNGNDIEVRSGNLGYRIPSIFRAGIKSAKGLLYWLIFIGALLLFWLMLHRIIRKLFALNLPSEKGWDHIDQLMLKDNSLNSLLFIIGSPGSGKLRKIKELIKAGTIKGKGGVKLDEHPDLPESNVCIADMLLIPDNPEEFTLNKEWIALEQRILENEALVIVNHFEYDIKNPYTNNLKLNLLERILQRDKSKLIIISTVHPVNFLDSLNTLQLTGDSTRKPEHDLERWHVLLGHFRIMIEKLELTKVNDSATMEDWEKELSVETSYGHFMSRMRTPVLDKLRNERVNSHAQYDGDSLAFKMQVTSQYFYMYIWQSLTKEEKFLLFDLAEDGLVNPYDDYNLTLLLNKGLIIRHDGLLQLFNRGFRNFILTAIGSSEAMKLKNQVEDNGNWSKLRTPMMIVIVAVLLFLFASQQESYSKVITYLTIITAGVPTVLKFFSLFGSNSEKTG